jgi:site-specific recombinase XerD
MADLSRWTVAQGLRLGDLSPDQVERYLAVLWAGRKRVPTMRTLRPMVDWLRAQHVIPPAGEPEPPGPLDELLGRYRVWLLDERGLAARTVGRYQATALQFLQQRRSTTGGATGVEGLSGADVSTFLLGECSRGLAVGSAKGVVGALRSLLRFLHVQGLTPGALSAAVPPVAGWHDTALPPTLSASDVNALLASCDRSQPTGLRDFAILTMLARLGLRAGEIAGLELDDVDWRAGEVVIRGKSRRDDRLPLPAEVGEALSAYLSGGRPRVESRTLFLTRYAPLRKMHPNTVSRTVMFACQRAGLPPVRAHRLRHALATEMLRQGVALVEISQVLRHRDLATTAVYAKVDRTVLRQVARPWPGGAR